MNLEDVWYGNASSARVVRAILRPASWLFGGIVVVRNWMYDAFPSRVRRASIPVISIGNLSVGGTGKTPVAAYFVKLLRMRGYRPALVMRGYGSDERLVHERINPETQVFTGAERLSSIETAARSGADVAVLDDAFQHRSAARSLDVVLVSADRWRERLQLLPAGPLREPFASLRRADLVIVTRKAASDGEAQHVALALARYASAPIATVALLPRELVAADGSGATVAIAQLTGQTVLGVAGIGDPDAFIGQLRGLGAIVTEARFPDHHAYSASDASRLSAAAATHNYVITTEKDAVKLASLWPAKAGRLWYVSQVVAVTDGQSFIDAAILSALST